MEILTMSDPYYYDADYNINIEYQTEEKIKSRGRIVASSPSSVIKLSQLLYSATQKQTDK